MPSAFAPFHWPVQALGFAAGKAGRFFAEGEVPQAQAVEGGEFLGDVLPVGAKFKGGVDIHGHHFRKGQGLAFLLVKPTSTAAGA